MEQPDLRRIQQHQNIFGKHTISLLNAHVAESYIVGQFSTTIIHHQSA